MKRYLLAVALMAVPVWGKDLSSTPERSLPPFVFFVHHDTESAARLAALLPAGTVRPAGEFVDVFIVPRSEGSDGFMVTVTYRDDGSVNIERKACLAEPEGATRCTVPLKGGRIVSVSVTPLVVTGHTATVRNGDLK